MAQQGPLMMYQPETSILVNHFHLKNPLKVFEQKENNRLTSDFWIIKEFPLSVQTLDNLVVSTRIVIAKVYQHNELAFMHFLRHPIQQNINNRGLHQKNPKVVKGKIQLLDSK